MTRVHVAGGFTPHLARPADADPAERRPRYESRCLPTHALDAQPFPDASAAVRSLMVLRERQPVGFVHVEGVVVPRYAAHSKWRAIVVTREIDEVDSRGYLPAKTRLGDAVPEWGR